MSAEYDQYIKRHTSMVMIGYSWIVDHHLLEFIREILPELGSDYALQTQISLHDSSKYSIEEYEPYDLYFYNNRTNKVVTEFNYAWLHHIHNNPHHWQYWVLIEDDSEADSKTLPLDIPDDYILEMICDWWAFSWSKATEKIDYTGLDNSKITSHKNFESEWLFEIFNWYKAHKSKIIFSKKTEEKVGRILELLYKSLIVQYYDVEKMR